MNDTIITCLLGPAKLLIKTQKWCRFGWSCIAWSMSMDEKATLVQEMARYHQASSPIWANCDITRPPWVNLKLHIYVCLWYNIKIFMYNEVILDSPWIVQISWVSLPLWLAQLVWIYGQLNPAWNWSKLVAGLSITTVLLRISHFVAVCAL